MKRLHGLDKAAVIALMAMGLNFNGASAEETTQEKRSRISTREIRNVDQETSTEPPATGLGMESSAYETESTETVTQSAAERSPPAEQKMESGDTGRDLVGKQMYVAPKVGAVVPIDLSGYDPQFTWGGEIGFRAGEKMTLGVSVLTSQADVGALDLNITPILLRLGYYPNLGNGFYIGPQVGMVKESASVARSVLGGSDTEFAAGISLGYDYAITPVLSTGLEVSYATVFGEPDIYHLVNFIVPIKVHF